MQQNELPPTKKKKKSGAVPGKTPTVYPQLLCSRFRSQDVKMRFQRVLQTVNEEAEVRPENWRL